jgi:cytochrome c oxidase assembly factor CtaG
MAAIGCNLLQRAIIAANGRTSRLAAAIGHDFKGWLLSPWISVALYIAVALIWFVPDRRIESTAGT